MNKIVQRILDNTQLRSEIIAACERDGDPLTPQAISEWRKLRYGVPVRRVRTVARVTGLKPHVIRPDIFPRERG